MTTFSPLSVERLNLMVSVAPSAETLQPDMTGPLASSCVSGR